jgi:hypothetical protein
MTANQTDGSGQLTPLDWAGELGIQQFLIRKALAQAAVARVVQVKKVTAGANGAPSVVDVQPLEKMLDGANNATDHGIVPGIPCVRLQAGAFAVVADPSVGDIGLMVCCDRDISNIKTKPGGPATPGSNRIHDLADGIYIGTLFGPNPTATVKYDAGTSTLTLTDVVVQGDFKSTGAVIAGLNGADQVNLQTHRHGGVATGGGSTAAPTPGT